jgi:hypothetical protein
MPTYLYSCVNGHKVDVVHSMFEAPRLVCAECGELLYKRPMAATVLWSRFIEPSPAVARHLKNVDRKRDENARKYGS